MGEAKQTKKAFFLCVAENAPHFPLQAPAADIARWRGKYKTGRDKLRQARYQRQVKMGLIDKKWPLSPRLPEVPAWDSLTPAQQTIHLHKIAALEHPNEDKALFKVRIDVEDDCRS